MKNLFNIPANLRVLFGVSQLLTAIGGVVILILWLWAPLTIARNVGDLHVIPIPFLNAPLKLSTGSLSVKSEISNARDIEVTRITTQLSLNLVSIDPELVAAIRWTLLPSYICEVIFWLVIFGLLRALCTRIEHGEIFSDANLRAVRNVGLFLVASTIIDSALAIWTQVRLGGYLATHTTVTGINAVFDARIFPSTHLPIGDLATGLLVLLVAEAFRQGLALKKETELTV